LEITADMITEKAWEVVDRCLASRNPATAVPALALLAKRHREFSDKYETVNPAEVEELARRYGLDPGEVMAEAEAIVRDGTRS